VKNLNKKEVNSCLVITNIYDVIVYSQNGKSEKLKQVEISLTDCLACSGCITSAETVLVQQQSTDEMMRVFDTQKVF